MRDRRLHADADQTVGVIHRLPSVDCQFAATVVGVAVIADVKLRAVVHQIENSLRVIVKAGNRRRDDRSHFRERHHGAEMAQMEGRLAHHEHQFAAFLEANVRGARQQVIGEAVREAFDPKEYSRLR